MVDGQHPAMPFTRGGTQPTAAQGCL